MIRGLLRTNDACKAAFEVVSRSTLASRHASAAGDKPYSRSPEWEREVVDPTDTVNTLPLPTETLIQTRKDFRDGSLALRADPVEVERSQDKDKLNSFDELRRLSEPIAPNPECELPSIAREASALPVAQMRSSTVPTSRFGRLVQYGGALIHART